VEHESEQPTVLSLPPLSRRYCTFAGHGGKPLLAKPRLFDYLRSCISTRNRGDASGERVDPERVTQTKTKGV